MEEQPKPAEPRAPRCWPGVIVAPLVLKKVNPPKPQDKVEDEKEKEDGLER